MMDNRIFNVNGRGAGMLRETLRLAFIQDGFALPATAKGWKVSPEHGLILLWAISDGDNTANKFPVALDANSVSNMVFSWLSSEEAKTIPCKGWDADADHDGENVLGWRVYVEDWGRVGNEGYVICAVRPSYNWLGK